jgi:hypothetical protein
MLPAIVWLGLPVVTQHAGRPQTGDVNKARQIAALVAQGQMNLRDATDLAEKHVRGTAIEAAGDVVPPLLPPLDPEMRDAPNTTSRKSPAAGKRLVYEVRCFARDRVQTVRVDGASRKVIDVQELEPSRDRPGTP